MLVSRAEEKYVLSHVEYECIKNIIRNFMMLDRGRPYWIRSLYFDTPYDRDYLDKEIGVNERKKVRLRIYSLEDEFAKLEIKNKSGDYSVKETLKISREDAKSLIAGDSMPILAYGSELAVKIYNILNCEHRVPAVIVDYMREAYFLSVNNVRITFDSGIRALRDMTCYYAEGIATPVTFADEIIMEVKYNGALPDILIEAIRCVDLFRESVSKYCMSRTRIG